MGAAASHGPNLSWTLASKFWPTRNADVPPVNGPREGCAAGGRGKGRNGRGKRYWIRGVDKTEAAIADCEKEVGLVGFFDFRMDTLDGCVRKLTYGLHSVAVENGY